MSKESRFKESASRFQAAPGDMPESAGPSTQELVEQSEAEREPDWYEMDDAPKDEHPLLLTSDGVDAHEATWRKTRAFSHETLRFEPTGFWSKRNSGGQKIDFEPMGWRPMS